MRWPNETTTTTAQIISVLIRDASIDDILAFIEGEAKKDKKKKKRKRRRGKRDHGAKWVVPNTWDSASKRRIAKLMTVTVVPY